MRRHRVASSSSGIWLHEVLGEDAVGEQPADGDEVQEAVGEQGGGAAGCGGRTTGGGRSEDALSGRAANKG